jgi:hypothetical protein
MEAVCSSEMLVSTYKSTWCYTSEDQHRYLDTAREVQSLEKLSGAVSAGIELEWSLDWLGLSLRICSLWNIL